MAKTINAMTKLELVAAIHKKVAGAHPLVLRDVLSHQRMMRLPKSELRRELRTAHVIESGPCKGDVSFSRR